MLASFFSFSDGGKKVNEKLKAYCWLLERLHIAPLTFWKRITDSQSITLRDRQKPSVSLTILTQDFEIFPTNLPDLWRHIQVHREQSEIYHLLAGIINDAQFVEPDDSAFVNMWQSQRVLLEYCICVSMGMSVCCLLQIVIYISPLLSTLQTDFNVRALQPSKPETRTFGTCFNVYVRLAETLCGSHCFYVHFLCQSTKTNDQKTVGQHDCRIQKVPHTVACL